MPIFTGCVYFHDTGKNPTKLATLEAAIKYIHELRAELGEIPLYANAPGILMDDSYIFAATSTLVRDIIYVAIHSVNSSCHHDWRINIIY